MTNDEINVFLAFIDICYEQINARNKCSWVRFGHGSKEISTSAAIYFKTHNIWHTHIKNGMCKKLDGLYLYEEIYPGEISDFCVYTKHEHTETDINIKILSFSEHPDDKYPDKEWNHIRVYLEPRNFK